MIKKVFTLLIGIIRLKYFSVVIDDKYSDRKIFINSIKSDFNNLAIDLYLGLLCAARGAEVKVVLDDGLLEHQDFVQKMENRSYLNPVKKLKYRIRYYLVSYTYKWISSSSVSIITTSKIYDIMQSHIKLEELDDETLEPHASDSCNRYFQGTVEKNSTEYISYFKRSMFNCHVSQLIGLYSTHIFKSTHFFTSHAIYSCWGPAYDYVNKYSSTSKLVFGVNTYFSGKIFVSSQKLQCTAADSRLKTYINSTNSEGSEELAIAYLEERLSTNTKDTSVYYSDINETLVIEEGVKNILICPNVFWDGDINERNRIYENMTAWIVDTLQIARMKPDFRFYIRFHPAEVTWYENCVKFSDIISSLVKDLCDIENVYILDSDYKFNLYSVLAKFDAVCLYDGMVALEAAYLGVPVVLVGDGRYNVQDFGIQPDSISTYRDLFASAETFMKDYNVVANRLKALKVLSWYLSEASVDLDTMDNLTEDFGTSLRNINSTSFSLNNDMYAVFDAVK